MPLQIIALKLLMFLHCKKLRTFSVLIHSIYSPQHAEIPLKLNGLFAQYSLSFYLNQQ